MLSPMLVRLIFPFKINYLESFTTMKIKSQVAIAGLLFAGLLTTGCQQMGQQTSQQATEAPAAEVPAAVAPAPAPVRPAPAPMVPKVKAKGNYKGPVAMDPASQGAMQQYQQR
ncbi:hypothetical protein HMY34_05025 [Thiothrix subterranea]|uniref:hypothetical protein n=1 Tax=Thiothrix subterranea TaxID=2735563 RepID=UPI00192BB841|nr:hypothetical protein [Thiothrix subterranea]QQZ27257.1 hypothetical protein HMY34_05025 [Thiothrix subterranea]